MSKEIYRVIFDGVQTKATFQYSDAKESFIDWKEYMNSYLCFDKTVQVTKDHELILEYTHE